MTLKQKIGQRFCIGFSGTGLTEEFRRLVREYKVGNVILFSGNLESAEQARVLCNEIQELVKAETGYPAFICIDQEGGPVVRLPQGMVNVPGAMALAASGKTENVSEAARITAAELGRIGVNVNLAPVLDINSNQNNPAIGNRSFSPQAEEATAFGVAAVKAYNEAGLMCCGKHFPGHGDTSVDSHLDLPLVNRSLEELKRRELVPFKAAIDAGIPAIMTTHILFPKIEEKKLPATMSDIILKGILRQKLGFKGLIFSDGMEMDAVKKFYGVPHGCFLALSAGVDIVFICHESPDMEVSLGEINSAFEKGRFDAAEFDASVERILRYKELYAGYGTSLAENSWQSQNNSLMRSTLASNECGNVPPKGAPSLGDRPFFAGCLAYRSTIASATPDSELSFPRWFAEKFGGSFQETPVNPDPADIAGTISAMPLSSAVVFGTYNGHLNRGQMELARALFETAKQRGIPFALLALRNPWDISLLPDGVYGLALWEYTEKSFEAAAAVFRGEFIPSGRLPRLT
jgi:beta-N-acetylhexosaminidase